MQTRDIAKLQYEKGQQIKATDVNDQMKAAFTRFNDMGPTDTLPLTTGQFRVYEPTIGYKLRAQFDVANNWIAVAPTGAAVSAVSFDCPVGGAQQLFAIGDGAAGYLDLLTVGHRYTAYMKFQIVPAAATSVVVGMYNGITTTNIIRADTITGALTTTNTLFGTFVAIDRKFSVGGRIINAGAAARVTILNQPQFDTAAHFAIYIFDWDLNEWLIPNYCGFMHPATFGISGTGERREQHALMCQAIKKEIDAANEVLSYL